MTSSKKRAIIGIIIVILVAGGIVFYKQNNKPAPNLISAEYSVAGIVDAFGKNMKNVSVLAPEEEVISAIGVHYKPFLTEDLFESWKADLSKVPGRKTSSPYPDRIEISSVSKISNKSYQVVGNVIEVASGTGSVLTTTDTYPLTFNFVSSKNIWLISSVE